MARADAYERHDVEMQPSGTTCCGRTVETTGTLFSFFFLFLSFCYCGRWISSGSGAGWMVEKWTAHSPQAPKRPSGEGVAGAKRRRGGGKELICGQTSHPTWITGRDRGPSSEKLKSNKRQTRLAPRSAPLLFLHPSHPLSLNHSLSLRGLISPSLIHIINHTFAPFRS